MPGRFTEEELEEVPEEDEMVEEKILAEALPDDGVGATPPPVAAD